MKTIVLVLAACAGLAGCVVAPPGFGPPVYGSVSIDSGPYYRGDRGYRGDRDGDGVRNRFDRRPNNPYRY